MYIKHNPEQIIEFLRLVDTELNEPCTIILIGGSVVGLLYQSSHATSDIDHIPTTQRAFHEAVKRAQSKLLITVQSVGIYTAPYSFEDRLEPLGLDGLTKLNLLVPESHDLAIMKVARGHTADLDAIEDVHRKAPLSLEILLERYKESLTQVIGSIDQFKGNFLACVARLFGEETAARIEKQLPP